MPVWTTMNDLATGDLVTEADMDAIRGNIAYLLDPNKDRILRDNGGSYSTTSTSWVDVDSTNLAITLTTNGGPVLVTFSGSLYASASTVRIDLDVAVDGTLYSEASYGLVQSVGLGTSLSDTRPHSFAILVTGLAAGSHTFKLQWRLGNTGTGYMMASSTHSILQFSAIEL